MTITIITAFESSPDRGQGLARDMRVRWALEEVGQPYDVRLVSFKEMKEPAHLALHPFGQIPTYEEGDLALFESGAIVFHIAERHAGLLPDDANARARAITWMFAALSTVEPPIVERAIAKYPGARQGLVRRSACAILDDRIRVRLGELSSRLGDADWLDGAFSAGDLLMVHVLRRLEGIGHTGGISEPLRLYRPRRSAARLQACFRRSIGGFHRQAADWLINVRSGPEAVIALSRDLNCKLYLAVTPAGRKRPVSACRAPGCTSRASVIALRPCQVRRSITRHAAPRSTCIRRAMRASAGSARMVCSASDHGT